MWARVYETVFSSRAAIRPAYIAVTRILTFLVLCKQCNDLINQLDARPSLSLRLSNDLWISPFVLLYCIV